MNWGPFISMLLNKRTKSKQKENPKLNKLVEQLNEMDFLTALKHTKKLNK